MTEKPATRASQAPHGPHTPPGGPGPHPAPADASQGRTELRDRIAEAVGLARNGPASDGRGWYRTAGDRLECYAVADAVLPVVEAALADAVRHRDQAENRAALFREQVRSEHERAEQAEAAAQRVRRLQEMTIASSCRAGAIEQAEDTLRLLDGTRRTNEARADAVLSVVEAALGAKDAEIERLRDDLKWTRSECAKADAENRAAGKRAEEAERQRDEALAAVRRVRTEVDDLMQCQRSLDPSERMRCAMCGGDHLAGIAAALKPKETR